MKKIICSIMLVSVLFLSGCSARNLDDVKTNSESTWKQAGFQIIGYEGYQWGFVFPFSNYGGARVWYTVHKIPDNGITYHGFLMKWGTEYHIYNLKAIDALKP